ncbi:MAG: hypothetical protein JSS95_16535 [Acidobacteria bacterium]|nr:hypothetical protein [Acidobacteriota bacterium]
MTKPDQSSPNDEVARTKREEQTLAPEDFYYEGPYIVFTEAYHLKRGYCCNSNCRHCPYRWNAT